MRAEELDPTFQNNNNDHLMQRRLRDSRKPTITLRTLNKLKRMRAAKDVVNMTRNNFLQTIYGLPEEGMGGGM